jgi:hypothetical protein
VGVYRRLYEHGYTLNYFASVPVDGINCAIITGNPRKEQLDKLIIL